jgi:hypothetical protein
MEQQRIVLEPLDDAQPTLWWQRALAVLATATAGVPTLALITNAIASHGVVVFFVLHVAGVALTALPAFVGDRYGFRFLGTGIGIGSVVIGIFGVAFGFFVLIPSGLVLLVAATVGTKLGWIAWILPALFCFGLGYLLPH